VSESPTTVDRLRESLQKGWARFAQAPKPLRVLVAGAVATMVVFGAVLGVMHASEPYAPVFRGLEKEDAALVVQKLKEQKVPYRLTDGGTSVEIPEARINEVRLDLAAAGLPRGGGVGFESFDKLRLGATDFEQRVLYRRSLEGELVRSISAMKPVQSARVHLVLPERSVFVSRAEPASASVIVGLKPLQTLGAGEVNGIVDLVAASVQGLSKTRVSVVSTDGKVLHRSRGDGEEGAGQDGEEEQLRDRAMELELEERARQLLERVVGVGHADVRVSAEVERAKVERVEDRYDPTKAAVRSEERSVEQRALQDSVGGVPGAESNLPTGAGAGAGDGGAASPAKTKETQVRNYEIDHVFEKRTQHARTLKRLTVAVIIDGVPAPAGGKVPRSAEELDKLGGLVRTAVGVDDRRGDNVSIQSMPFPDVERPAALAAAADPAATGPVATAAALQKKYRWLAPAVAGGIVLMVVAAVVWRRKKSRQRAKEQKPETLAKEVEAVIAPAQEPARSAPDVPLDPDALREAVQSRASEDPATAALALRAWLKDVPLPSAEAPPVAKAA
jgi:flagellar M-ring protein FliF